MKTLILGGVRSGKSRYAEQLAIQTAESNQSQLIYIATSFPQDDEMHQRVREHQQQRELSGKNWITVEEDLYLAEALEQQDAATHTILVDCLTLWMTNLLCHENKNLLVQETERLLAALSKLSANIIFVSNETGLGVVPMDTLSRQFVDKMGLFHQELAARCERVVFVTAGLAHVLKDNKINPEIT